MSHLGHGHITETSLQQEKRRGKLLCDWWTVVWWWGLSPEGRRPRDVKNCSRWALGHLPPTQDFHELPLSWELSGDLCAFLSPSQAFLFAHFSTNINAPPGASGFHCLWLFPSCAPLGWAVPFPPLDLSLLVTDIFSFNQVFLPVSPAPAYPLLSQSNSFFYSWGHFSSILSPTNVISALSGIIILPNVMGILSNLASDSDKVLQAQTPEHTQRDSDTTSCAHRPHVCNSYAMYLPHAKWQVFTWHIQPIPHFHITPSAYISETSHVIPTLHGPMLCQYTWHIPYMLYTCLRPHIHYLTHTHSPQPF